MQKTFEVDGPVELDIRVAAGEIVVDPTLHDRVEVDLEGHDEESRRLVEQARVELREGARPEVLVDVPQRRSWGISISFGRQGVSCRVRCPVDSPLDVRTKSADVEARGRVGSLKVTTASGDVAVDHVTGDVDVKSASGDVSVRTVGGNTSVQTASGDVEIEVAHGPVSVQSASGDVRIDEAYDDVKATTVSGDVHHGAVMTGRVTAQSVSGDISIGVRRGSTAFLDCSTLSGDTQSDLEATGDAPDGEGPLVEIRAKSVSGDIHVTRAAAPADPQEVHT
ncbi:MAG TPA: DUF4097 family beta strand repeat-containing protein [Gaiellaceae bacterium]|nr:DUF4097 family beta strand repeat-containing protein [Gaiellaceae bacterium]